MFVFSFNVCEETGKTKGRQNYNILVGVTNYYIKIWWTKNIGNLWFLICKNNNKPKATFETHFWNWHSKGVGVGSSDDGDPGAKTSHKGKISAGSPAGAEWLWKYNDCFYNL